MLGMLGAVLFNLGIVLFVMTLRIALVVATAWFAFTAGTVLFG